MEETDVVRTPRGRAARVLLHATLLAPAAYWWVRFAWMEHVAEVNPRHVPFLLVLTGPGAAGILGSLGLAATPDAAWQRGGLAVLLLRLGVGLGTLCALLWRGIL